MMLKLSDNILFLKEGDHNGWRDFEYEFVVKETYLDILFSS